MEDKNKNVETYTLTENAQQKIFEATKVDNIVRSLIDTDYNLIEKAMVEIENHYRSAVDSHIMNNIYQTSIEIGIKVDKAKLERWYYLCVEIEKLSEEEIRELKMITFKKRSEAKINSLTKKNESQAAELKRLRVAVRELTNLED